MKDKDLELEILNKQITYHPNDFQSKKNRQGLDWLKRLALSKKIDFVNDFRQGVE